MRKGVILVTATLALTGCETTEETRGPKADLNSLPEYAEHQRCLGRQTFMYSSAEGSPLELGIIASSACGRTRYALYEAIAKIESLAFARGYISVAEQNDAKRIAGAIIKVRQGHAPI